MSITRLNAKKIVDSFREKIEYGLSITDASGIILASTDSARLETFHELAYTLILSKKQNPIKVTQSSDYLGARTGVCMVLHCEGEIAGAFALSGEPDKLFPLVKLMQIAIENALKYEIREQYASKGRDFRENFLSLLIYNSHSHEADLEFWAEQLHFDPYLVRVPILFSFDDDEGQSALLSVLKTSLPKQDILARTRDGQLLIFKALSPSVGSLLGTYTDIVRNQYAQVCNLFPLGDTMPSCYVGSFQEQLSAYAESCQHCFWLRRRHPDAGGLVFFYDHIEEYLYAQIPASEIYHIFSAISHQFDPTLSKSFGLIIDTLDKNNYNLVSSSKALFMHRNTLAAALEKIKEYTDMQPMRNSSHRKFLHLLSYYLEHVEGSKVTATGGR
ncbi:MAG: sugar diacid recognition domain-containing protein [Oscillospiraceae bacterium]